MEHNILYAYFLLPAPKLRATNILYKVTLGYYGDRRREITIQKTTDLSSAGVSKLVLLAIEMASSTSSYSHPLLGSPHTAPAHSSPAPYPLSFLTHSPHLHKLWQELGYCCSCHWQGGTNSPEPPSTQIVAESKKTGEFELSL